MDIEMTGEDAVLIRARFKSTDGWTELAEQFPRYAELIEALPDLALLPQCNVIFREMFEDAWKWARSFSGTRDDASHEDGWMA